MAYTHIQCIGYQVPTVAKVFDNTAPAANPTIPTGAGVPQPDASIVDTNTNNTLIDPPTNPNTKWTNYLGSLIGYLENPANATSTEINDMIDHLKYRTYWGDWTIPSTTLTGGNVAIQKKLFIFDAYTLKDTAADNANLTILNDNANIDAKNRVIRFLNVLYKASKDANIDKSKTTLKVFTAPEFYFRPKDTVANSNIYRAYEYTVYKAIKEVLRQTIKGMGLKHWLIVPGTMMWYMPANTTANNKTVTANTYFNSCIYIHNASNQQTSHKLEKARASRIDGVPYNDWDYGANAPAVLNKYRDQRLKKHLFDIGTTKTGLEICLEHTAGATHTNGQRYGILKHLVDHKGTSRPDLQLLVAGGMDTNLPSIALENNKVFFRNDGYYKKSLLISSNPDTYDEKYVDARKVTTVPPTSHLHLPALTAKEISLNGNNAFELQPPADAWPANPVNGNQYILPSMPFTEQQIVIFPTQEI